MKIGIMHVNLSSRNYGAVLHGWAFQQYLSRIPGAEDNELIFYTRPNQENHRLRFGVWNSLKQGHLRAVAGKTLKHVRGRVRHARFERFLHAHERFSRNYTRAQLNAARLPYDTLICESDVIWSSEITDGMLDPAYFLALDSMRGLRKIAYAPSLNDGPESDAQADEIREYARDFRALSCREAAGAACLSALTGRTVPQVLDPVLLLKPEDYEPLCARRPCRKPYLLMYMPVDISPLLRAEAKKYAQAHGLELLEISTHLRRGKGVLGQAGPREFLAAVRHADMIFTNSLHAVLFSILFERQFYAFPRRLSLKVTDALATFGLSERYMTDGLHPLPDIDYAPVRARLETMRASSREFLLTALGLPDARQADFSEAAGKFL